MLHGRRLLAIGAPVLLLLARSTLAQCLEEEFAPPVLQDSSRFGLSAAIDGGVAAVTQSGDVDVLHVYALAGGSWHPEQQLPIGPLSLNSTSVRASGTTLLVADFPEESLTFFERQGGTWSQTAMFLGNPGSQLGRGADLDGDFAVASTELEIRVHERIGGTWGQVQVIPGAPLTGFGRLLALDGDRFLATAGSTKKQVEVYDRIAGTWTKTATLTGGDNSFGTLGLALSGDTAAVSWNKNGFASRANVYELQGGEWTQTAELLPIQGMFERLELDGDRLIAGGPNADVVHMYERRCGDWVQTQVFDSGVEGDFGRSVGISGDRFIIGASNYADDCPVLTGDACEPGRVFFGSYVDEACRRALLVGTPDVLYWNEPGSQNLTLYADSLRANGLYWILGTVTGTVPGNNVLGIPMPLNVDPYYLFTFTQLGIPLIANAVGFLDGEGCAETSFNLPGGPSLAGITMHHAYVVGDALSPVPQFAPAVSEPVAVGFQETKLLMDQYFENGAPGWDFGPSYVLWHMAPDGECGAVSTMASYSVVPPACNYVWGTDNFGDLLSPTFVMGDKAPYRVRFTWRAELDDTGLDVLQVHLVDENTGEEFLVADTPELDTGGELRTQSFAPPPVTFTLTGRTMRLRFRFIGAEGGNQGLGWQVDAVSVNGVAVTN